MAMVETAQLDAEDRITKERKLLERFGTIIMAVSDGLDDEGDRVYLGSTNDRDLLRDACQEWFEHRYLFNLD